MYAKHFKNKKELKTWSRNNHCIAIAITHESEDFIIALISTRKLVYNKCDIPPTKSLKTHYKKRDSLDCYEYIESMDFSNVLTAQQKYYLNKDMVKKKKY